MALETPTANNPARSTGWGERTKQIVVWLLLIGLLAEIGWEASARYNFQKSLAALSEKSRVEQEAGRKLSASDAALLVSGWPSASDQYSATADMREYRWRSIVWDLAIQLQIDTSGAVAAIKVGSGGTPRATSDLAAAGQPGAPPIPSQPFDPQSSVASSQAVPQKLLGSSAQSPAAVALAVGEKGDGFMQQSAERGRLILEIVRQALLISARDEFNLPTRDAALGDILPDDDNVILPQLVATMSIDASRQVLINIDRQCRGGPSNPVASHQFQLSPGPVIDTLVSKAEGLSANEFLATLHKAGFTGSGHEYLPTATVDKQIVKNLNAFEILSQLGAVRALHSEIRKTGEAPERLAELARGYAHLAAMCQFLWSPAYDAFAARSLIYAERLFRKANGSPFALWHRAYVRALVGLHTSALEDLSRAAAAADGAVAPVWADAIDAFCRGNLAQLSKVAEQNSLTPLPQFLRLLATAPSEIPTVRLDSAVLMLKAQPDCELAFDVALDKSGLGLQRQMSGQAVTRFSATLREHLKSNADVPLDVQKLVAAPSGDLKSEMTSQAQIIDALRQASSIQRDAGEPSLAALAQVVQDVSFVNACRLLHIEKFSLSVDPTRTLAALRPIFKGHRYEQFADVHVWDHTKADESLRHFYYSLNRDQLELAASPMLDVMKSHWSSTNDGGIGFVLPLGGVILQHSDRTFGDQARALRIRADDSLKQQAAAALREISPGSVVSVAAAIKYDWEQVKSSAAEWERAYADDIGVQGALAEAYTSRNLFEDAVRCRKRQIELLPEQTAYRALADLYKQHRDEQLWAETLANSLQAPAFGLEHAQSHSELAYYHMGRKEWDAARPHADRAAQSYSAWGLLCAAEFYEKIGDWDRSDLMRRREAERYTGHKSGLRWYIWCRATGHGNFAAARPLALRDIGEMKGPLTDADQEELGLFYVLDDQPAEALKAFREAARLDVDSAYDCLHSALLADELGKPELRDELLNEARIRGNRQSGYLVEIVSAFQSCLESGANQPDLNVIDWAIRDRIGDAGNPTNEFYFVGKFLALRGREAQAREYLQRSATSPGFSHHTCKMAAHALLKAGVALAERRDFAFDDATSRKLDSLKEANEFRNARKWDQALPAYEKLIAEHPDFADARFERALGFRDRGEYGPAIDDLTRAHELVPGCAQFLYSRGEVLEYEGRYPAAIKDYEEAIRIDRRYVHAHYNLAFLRAACPEQEFRSSQQALEHARIVQKLPGVDPDLKLALLAAAFAEAGDFDNATRYQRDALGVTPSDRLELAAGRLELYRRGEPYHRKPQWWRRHYGARFIGRSSIEIQNSAGMLDLNSDFTIEICAKWRISERMECIAGDEAWPDMSPAINVAHEHGWTLRKRRVERQDVLEFVVATDKGWTTLPWALPTLPVKWMQIAVCRHDDRLALFVDGAQQASANLKGLRLVNSPTPLYLGVRQHAFHNREFDGFIRSFRISNTTRRTASYTPPESFTSDDQTLVLFDFSDTTEKSIQDQSGHARNGVLNSVELVP